MGIPVVATYVGGVVELVIDQQTGLVVYPSDSVGLKNAIARYIDDGAFYQAIAKNARKKVETEFDIENQVDKLAQLFTHSDLSKFSQD